MISMDEKEILKYLHPAELEEIEEILNAKVRK